MGAGGIIISIRGIRLRPTIIAPPQSKSINLPNSPENTPQYAE